MERYLKTEYDIEVDHESGTFQQDMDFLSSNPKVVYEHLQRIKEKYKGHKITITKITTTEEREEISENVLELVANK